MAATTRITYIGPHDAVDVPAAGIAGLARGSTVEVSSRLAETLLTQTDNWTKAKGA